MSEYKPIPREQRTMPLVDYYKYLRENDPHLKGAYERTHYEDERRETFKEQFTPEFIYHVKKILELEHRDIARILGCVRGTVSKYVRPYNEMLVDEIEFNSRNYIEMLEDQEFDHPYMQNMTVEENVFLVISDLQAGAMITADGFDRFPFKTMWKYYDKLIDGLTKKIMDRKIYIKNFNLVFLGDLVEGEGIYPGQFTEAVKDQMELVSQIVISLMKYISKIFRPENLNIYSVLGNHGRVTKNHKKGDNWDVILMNTVKKNIAWLKPYDDLYSCINDYISEDRVQVHTIGKWNYLMTHGDQLRPTMTNLIKKSFGWGNVYKPHHAMLLGHWHQFKWISLDGIQVVMGGCTYESPFVQEEIAGKEDMVQLLFASSDASPIEWLELIDVELEPEEKAL